MLGVGSTIWLHDTNRREYDTGPGRRLLFRKQFVPRVITGETRLSWLVNDTRIPKRGEGDVRHSTERGFSRTWYLTAKAVEDECWQRDNFGKVLFAVQACKDVEKLKQIAALLGVQEVPPHG